MNQITPEESRSHQPSSVAVSMRLLWGEASSRSLKIFILKAYGEPHCGGSGTSFEGIQASTVNLAAARKCVDWMVVAILQLNERAGFEVQAAAWIHDLVITSATQAAILWSHGSSEQARISLFHAWLDQSLAVKPTSMLIDNWDEMYAIRNRLVHGLVDASDQSLLPSELDREFLLIFGLAATEKVRANTLESQARQSLRNVFVRLALSTSDLSQLFGVSSDEIETWESDHSPMRAEFRSVINRVSSGVNRLLTMFRPERLPEVLRREAELFGGQSALDCILQGRIEDVQRTGAYSSEPILTMRFSAK